MMFREESGHLLSASPVSRDSFGGLFDLQGGAK